MQRINTFLRTCGMVSFFGLAALALPLPAHAGDLRVSIGFGVPMPVVVAPQPVIVHRAPGGLCATADSVYPALLRGLSEALETPPP